MEKVNVSDADQISEALVIWIGPVPSLGYDGEAALVERFGATVAAKLVPVLQAVKHDCYGSTTASDRADSLRDVHQLAFDDFKRKHPELSDAAIQAIANRYTYDNR
jgi:hypothetical protein